MKAVQITKPNTLQIIEIEKPDIDNVNNVLVRMTAAGICGSDVGISNEVLSSRNSWNGNSLSVFSDRGVGMLPDCSFMKMLFSAKGNNFFRNASRQGGSHATYGTEPETIRTKRLSALHYFCTDGTMRLETLSRPVSGSDKIHGR